MGRSTTDELSSIQQAWPWFEQLVGLRGRKMFAQVDESAGTHTVCTPVTSGDRPERLRISLAERSTTSTSRSRRFRKGTTSASKPVAIAALVRLGACTSTALDAPEVAS
ncbi:MAG TPA: hypothetical protein VH084_06030 [Mycobacterium sp.]|jgi:hypothetical protein|nr:hypothetical protein [Mycobacterium sp.]